MTIREALRSAVEHLTRHHISSARLQSEVLLSHVLSVEKTHLYTHDDRILPDRDLAAFDKAVSDRASGIPLQYIVGRQEFYGRNFRVNPAVLIPRPETEHLIDTMMALQRNGELLPGAQIIDVGTGSGCIAVTLALELPETSVFAGDISEEALSVAHENARALGAHVNFVCADLLDGIGGGFDCIVSNPPYVKKEDLYWLQREVREHEPALALFSPGDECAFYRRLIPAAYERLKPGGHLLLEIGIGMEERVLQLFAEGWEKLPTQADLQGIPRTIIARVSSSADQ